MAKKIHQVSDVEPKFKELFMKIREIYLLGIDLQYLYGEDNSKINPDILESVFMERMGESFKINFVLKICSYLDRDDDINILSFVDRLLVNHRNSEWKSLIEIQELKQFQKELQEIKETTAIKTLVHFRNKIYAHTDKNYADTDLKTDLKLVFVELEKLRTQFKTIGSKIFKSQYIVKSFHFHKDHYLLEDISRFFDMLDLIEATKRKKKNSITISEFESISNRYQKPNEYFELN